MRHSGEDGSSGRAGASGFDRGRALVVMGLFGAALIYGDGIITPAISVLSALEGVNVATDALEPYVTPMAVAILLCLFGVQGRGTARIGKVFGPLDAAVVRCHRGARYRRHCASSAGARRSRPTKCHRLPGAQRLGWL